MNMTTRSDFVTPIENPEPSAIKLQLSIARTVEVTLKFMPVYTVSGRGDAKPTLSGGFRFLFGSTQSGTPIA